MARQYFNSTSADSLIVSASAGANTTLAYVLTPAQANQAFPVGFGQAAPFAGQVYKFAMGGIITTSATAGTLLVTPIFGPGSSQTAGGTVMGASTAQTVVASLTNAVWLLEGYIVFRSISAVATTSTAWLSGTFTMPGTLATAGAGCSVSFGSTAAVSVDTTGTGTAGTFGALNFGFTFSQSSTITAEWTSMQSLN